MKATSIAIAAVMLIPAADAYAQSDAIHPTAARSDALRASIFNEIRTVRGL